MQINGINVSGGVRVDGAFPTQGLIAWIDPTNKNCYSGTGSTVYDLVTGNTCSLVGTYGYDTTTFTAPAITLNNNSTSSNGGLNLDSLGTTQLNTLAANASLTYIIAYRKNYYGVGGNNSGDTVLMQVGGGFSDGWRVREAQTGTPGAAFTNPTIPGTTAYYATFSLGGISPGWSSDYAAGYSLNMGTLGFIYSPKYMIAITGTSTSLSTFVTVQSTWSGTYVTQSFAASPNIGAAGGGVGSLNGLLCQVMVYNRPLSISECKDAMLYVRNKYGQ